MLDRRGPVAAAVATKLEYEQIRPDRVVQRSDAIVIADDLPIAVEVDDRRTVRVYFVAPRSNRHTAADLDDMIGRSRRRRRGIGSGEEDLSAGTAPVEQ